MIVFHLSGMEQTAHILIPAVNAAGMRLQAECIQITLSHHGILFIRHLFPTILRLFGEKVITEIIPCSQKHCKASSIFSGFLRPDLPKAAFSSIVSAMPAVSTAAGRTILSTVSVAVEGNTPSAFPVCPTDCPVTGAVLFPRISSFHTLLHQLSNFPLIFHPFHYLGLCNITKITLKTPFYKHLPHTTAKSD